MAAQLYPGIKSLHLVLDTPYDLIRTDDIRDDIVGVKVWYSSTSGFNPNLNQGTLVFDGIGFSITISDLLPNTRYYVKYAFISAIDPTTYTISSELTALVYDENVTVYGYLTNDPVPIVTNSDGTGGDFSRATGVFKVFQLSQDVTGLGPVYAIKSGSNNNITGAVIDPVTGIYSCTNITANSADITFTATYAGIVVEQVWNIYKGLAGETAPLIQLVATNTDFVYKDQFSTVAETTQTVITAKLTNLVDVNAVFSTKAYTRAGVELGTGNLQIAFTQTGNTITITREQFGVFGVTLGSVVVTAAVGSVSDSLVVYRINDGTEQITVELSNSAHLIPAANNGDTVPANYVGSGTTIKVKQGNTYLNVDSASPYDSLATWNIFNITSVGITCDPTPTIGLDSVNFDTHAAMTADQAYIDYTILYRTSSGVEGSQIVRQSFAKSREGLEGSSARLVNINATSQAFITPKNSSTTTTSIIVLTASASNFNSPMYSWLVDNVPVTSDIGVVSGNTLTLNSFSAPGVKLVKVTVSENEFSAFDTFSVYSLREGDDSVMVGLSNENQSIACDSTGTPIVGQFPLQSQFYVAMGNTLLNSTTNPPVVFAKVSYSGGNDSSYSISADGIITINSINAQFAEALFSATVRGVVYYKTLSLNKTSDGFSAPVINLSSTGQIFVTAKNTATISPSSVTFTAAVFNLGGSPQYVWKVSTNGGSTFVTQSGQTASTFTLSSFASGTKIVRAEVTGGGSTVYDQATVYSLKEGDDSLAAGLTNENQTISCDSAGTPIGGQFPISSQLLVVRGAQVLTSANGVVWSKISETGMTSSIGSTTGIITITGITGTNASATYRASINGVALDKTFTLNKSFNGAQGLQGPQGLQGLQGLPGDNGDPGTPGAIGITTRIAYQLVSQTTAAPSYSTTTSGGTSLPGVSWQASPPAATVGNVVWYSYGRYNANAFFHEGISANTTAWSAPIAASVFQDIRSDNWNGSTPSSLVGVINFAGATNGYYFKKSDGTLWATDTYMRGNVVALGKTTNISRLVYIGPSLYAVIPAINGQADGGGVSDPALQGNIRAGIYGYSQNNPNSAWNVGVLGYGQDSARGIGVAASSQYVGLYAETSNTNGSAIQGRGADGSGRAGTFEGTVRITGLLECLSNITATGSISAVGNIIAYTSSDLTLKNNVTRITNPLEKLRGLGGYSYDWKPEYLEKFTKEVDLGLVKPHDVGVIAQEVQKQLPSAVATRPDGTLAVSYEKLIPLLIEAVLELDRRTR